MSRRPAACLLAAAVLLAAPVRVAGAGAGPETQAALAQRMLEAGQEAAHRGSYEEAGQTLAAALAACRAEADQRCEWTALYSLAVVARVLGDTQGAKAHVQEAAALAHKMGDRAAQGESYHLLALVLAESGELAEAASASERALAVGMELGRDDLQAWALTAQGEVALAQEKPEEACRAFGQAMAKAVDSGRSPLKSRALLGSGRCLLAQGMHAEAEAAFDEALGASARAGDKLSVARLLQEMGRLRAAEGEHREAEEVLLDALRKYRSLGAGSYALKTEADLEKLRSAAALPTEAERPKKASEAKSRGLERLEGGDLEAAVRELKTATYLSPYDAEAHLALAGAYRSLGLFILAEEEERFAEGLSHNGTPFDLSSKNPQYLDYFSLVRRQIDRVYVVPAEVASGELSGMVRVSFTIERSGRLLDVAVETTAGEVVLDRAALRTLELAKPFEPFPDSVTQERVTITARFVYEKELARGNPGP